METCYYELLDLSVEFLLETLLADIVTRQLNIRFTLETVDLYKLAIEFI